MCLENGKKNKAKQKHKHIIEELVYHLEEKALVLGGLWWYFFQVNVNASS